MLIRSQHDNVIAQGNCLVTLKYELTGERKRFWFRNSVTTDYFSQIAKLVKDGVTDFNMELKVVELLNASGEFMIRQQPTEKWTSGGEAIFYFYFNSLEANGTARTLKMYYADATTLQDSGRLLSSLDVNIPKTSDYTMSILYFLRFQNRS